jgi:hypothetical protein
LNQEQAAVRLASQPSRAEKKAQLEYSAPGAPLVFIENNGTLEELSRVVEPEWQRFLSPRSTVAR